VYGSKTPKLLVFLNLIWTFFKKSQINFALVIGLKSVTVKSWLCTIGLACNCTKVKNKMSIVGSRYNMIRQTKYVLSFHHSFKIRSSLIGWPVTWPIRTWNRAGLKKNREGKIPVWPGDPARSGQKLGCNPLTFILTMSFWFFLRIDPDDPVTRSKPDTRVLDRVYKLWFWHYSLF
jgi:hypothetical protein